MADNYATIINMIRTSDLKPIELDTIIELCQMLSIQLEPDLGTDKPNLDSGLIKPVPDNVIDIPALRRAGKFPTVTKINIPLFPVKGQNPI